VSFIVFKPLRFPEWESDTETRPQQRLLWKSVIFGNQFINARRVISTVVVIEPKHLLSRLQVYHSETPFQNYFSSTKNWCCIFSIYKILLAIESL
jgi:hypothetical protein